MTSRIPILDHQKAIENGNSSYGTILTMNGSQVHRQSHEADSDDAGMETAPTEAGDAARNQSIAAKMRDVSSAETKAISRWRHISGLALFIITLLLLVALVVEAVRYSNDNHSENPVSRSEQTKLGIRRIWRSLS
jgi:hypothetical protein